jgi:hypothetical protein
MWRRIAALVAAGAVLYALAALAIFPRWTVDDAYITYRYAENLALHGELTWNVGEDPVEGYTGVLLPTLLAGAIRLGGDPNVASKLLGCLSLLASGLLLLYALRRFGAPHAVAAGAAACYLSTPVIYPHAWGGLETCEYTALLLASLASFARAGEGHEGARREARFFLLLLATSLARPEGLLFAGCSTLALVGAP